MSKWDELPGIHEVNCDCQLCSEWGPGQCPHCGERAVPGFATCRWESCERAEERVRRIRESVAPAHSAEGQKCGQCGAPAWHVEAMPFCLEHDQGTLSRIVQVIRD